MDPFSTSCDLRFLCCVLCVRWRLTSCSVLCAQSVIPSVLNYNALGGLCGLYDGLAYNDFTSSLNHTMPSGSTSEALAGAFAETWRVRSGDSLFMNAPASGLSGQRRVTDQSFPIGWSGESYAQSGSGA